MPTHPKPLIKALVCLCPVGQQDKCGTRADAEAWSGYAHSRRTGIELEDLAVGLKLRVVGLSGGRGACRSGACRQG